MSESPVEQTGGLFRDRVQGLLRSYILDVAWERGAVLGHRCPEDRFVGGDHRNEQASVARRDVDEAQPVRHAGLQRFIVPHLQ